MNFWWVNQNQTYDQETGGGYLWSPKRNNNGARNPFYDFMKMVVPGDLVFSFKDTYIKAIGVIRSHAYAAPQPMEFGRVGSQWGSNGWKVDAHFIFLDNEIRPRDNMDLLRPELPNRYAPIQANGNGNQGVYLTRLPESFAHILVRLIGKQVADIVSNLYNVNEPQSPKYFDETTQGLIEWEEVLENTIRDDEQISETEKRTIILARRGQGVFRRKVETVEKHCRITLVNEMTHLRASHIKPWRYCDDHIEKLSGNNGLLLTPSIDHLFDRGFISFDDDGEILVSPVANQESLTKMGFDITLKKMLAILIMNKNIL